MFDEEQMIHGGPRRIQERLRATSAVVPRAVAESVLEEAQTWLGQELPADWVVPLSRKGESVCSRNARFRRRIHGPGTAGRDWLWTFTRHWLAAMLRRERPDLYQRLPPSFATGHALTNH